MHTFLRGPEFCLMFRKVQSNKIYLTSIEKIQYSPNTRTEIGIVPNEWIDY